MKKTFLTLAIFALFSAQADYVYLNPSKSALSKADWVSFDMSTTESLFESESPIPVKFVKVLSPKGEQVELNKPTTSKTRATFDVKIKEKGTYVARGEGYLIFGKIKKDGKPACFEGTVEMYNQLSDENKKPENFYEYNGQMETFVSYGEPTDQNLAPSSKGLDVKFGKHPNDFYTGEPVELTFMMDGQPKADLGLVVLLGSLDMKSLPEHTKDLKQKQTLQTDKDGKVTVTFPVAGKYVIMSYVQDTNARVKGMERSVIYSVTVDVQPQ